MLWLVPLGCWNEPTQPAAMLVLTRAPAGWARNRVFLPAGPIVQLADADGDVVRDARTKITVAITSGEGTLLGTTTVGTDSIGAATFEDLALAGPVGAKTLTFSSPGLLSARSSINLRAGTAANVAPGKGQDQAAAPGTVLAISPSVRVSDMDANPVEGVLVTFAVASGGGSITDASTLTDTSGVAAVGSWTLGAASGTNILTVTAEGLSGSPIAFTAASSPGLLPGVGCFIDDQGRTYCVDPGPLGSEQGSGAH
jgi:hypothetical protein